jgi:glutamate formiminotransferase
MSGAGAPWTPNLVECVPNVSEGRRPHIIGEIGSAAAGVPGVRLLDVHSDHDHHRSVYTLVGAPEPLEEAVFRLAEAAISRIDMDQHHGVHPRMGAVDVVPFIPLGGTSMQLCIDLAHGLGQRVALELGIPVYFYGEAAVRPERRLLADIRRGEYEGLRATVGTDRARDPDAGPARVGPAGAMAIGARGPLVAFNMHLRTGNVGVARAIASAVRSSSGGLPGVQALGLPTSRPEIVQVSMNLTDLETTPLHVVAQAVRAQAERRGVALAESELVGLMPLSASLQASSAILGLPTLSLGQVIELAVQGV